jgi:hypothetical protein
MSFVDSRLIAATPAAGERRRRRATLCSKHRWSGGRPRLLNQFRDQTAGGPHQSHGSGESLAIHIAARSLLLREKEEQRGLLELGEGVG